VGNSVDTIDVVFLVEETSLLLDIAGPADAFRSANVQLKQCGDQPKFRMRFVAPTPEATLSVGMAIASLEPLPQTFFESTWVVLVGKPTSTGARPTNSSNSSVSSVSSVHDWLRRCVAPSVGTTVRLITICEGAVTAARAGLFDGYRCTTHHEVLDELARVAPQAKLERNRVYVLDGPVASCAGATAGLDLALALIAETCGDRIAGLVAQTLNVYVRRGPNDPEKSPLLEYRNHLSAAVHQVQDAVLADPQREWTAELLAGVGAVSVRHLDRLFLEHVGIRPRQFLTDVRLERARVALGQGRSVTEASMLAGFSSDQQFRRAWRETHETTPSARRRDLA
jgi:transcriptional regulator GlxA family with amidase domain